MRWTRASAVVLGLAAALVLGVSAASAHPEDNVSVSALLVNTHQPGYDVLIKNFNNVYKDITIGPVTYLPSGTIRTLLLTELQSGSAPDLFFTNGGNAAPSAVWPLAKAGKLLDLSSGPWVKRLTGLVKPDLEYGGKIYALPVAAFLEGVAYNPAVFSQLKLKVPQTFGQLLQMCGTITKAGKIPFAQGFGELNGFSNWEAVLSTLVYAKQANWNTLRDQHKVSFQTSATWRRALTMLIDMKNASCFSPGVAGTTVANAYSQLAKGDAAMSVLATVQTGALQAVVPTFQPGWFSFPFDSAKDTRVVVNASGNLSVNAATKNPQQARTFINFLGRPKQASLFAKITGGVSDYDVKKCVLPATLKEFLPMCKAGKVIAAETGRWANQNLGLAYLNPSMQGLITGQKSVDDILKGLDYLWDNPTATSPPN
jgi:raffinose/stachyose/melibiose transport system substrate-binding protein